MRASGQTGSTVQQTTMSEARIFQPFFTHLPTSSVLMLVMNVCRSFPLITVELYLHAPEYLQNKYINYCAANTCTALLPTKKKFGVTLFKMLVNINKFQCTAASVCVIYCWNVFFSFLPLFWIKLGKIFAQDSSPFKCMVCEEMG